MRKTSIIAVAAIAGFISAPAFAADLIPYPPVYEIPPVDHDLGGSFYLRGSVGVDAWHAVSGVYCGCVTSFDAPGLGFDFGVGIGYETGDGLRADVTLDYLQLDNLTSSADATVDLKSGLLMANAYYDFMLDGGSHAQGGWGAYVGAGIGLAYNYTDIHDASNDLVAWGDSLEGAAAVMTGITYDMGHMVAELGYRAIYMDKVTNTPVSDPAGYRIDDNFIHQVRGTVRYRF